MLPLIGSKLPTRQIGHWSSAGTAGLVVVQGINMMHQHLPILSDNVAFVPRSGVDAILQQRHDLRLKDRNPAVCIVMQG